MNRRGFLKSIGLMAAAVPVAGAASMLGPVVPGVHNSVDVTPGELESERHFWDLTTSPAATSVHPLIETMLRTAAGRERLAVSLGRAITRRVDVKRDRRSITPEIARSHGYRVLPRRHLYQASIGLFDLKDRRFDLLQDALTVAKDQLLLNEDRMLQSARQHNVNLVPLSAVVQSTDDRRMLRIGFTIIQQYAIVS